MYYLIDIDGFIADVRWLLPLIQGESKDFDTYYGRILEAKPIESGVEFIRFLKAKGITPVYLTGRNDKCRESTKQWLNSLFCDYEIFDYPVFDKDLLMRSEGDRRPVWVMKRDKTLALLESTGTTANQWVAIDDHAQNIAMFRELGMTTMHVQSDASFSE